MITDYTKGEFIRQTVSYESLMKRRVKKHPSFFQPIFEAVSNALEATNGKDDEIIIRLRVSYVFLPNSPVYGGTRGEGALYMEVLKYSTLLNRAKIRNSIFTEKLFDDEKDMG